MDRLYTVATVVSLVALTVAGCEQDESARDEEPPGRGRVNAVQAKPEPEAPPPEAFCDVYHSASEAPAFEYPELDSEPPAAPESGWRWVNVWATWCKPCIEEMPRLVKWEDEMDQIGDLVLLSADESRKLVTSFRKEHPETPESLLIDSPARLKPWLEKLGLFKGASLPIHIFVDPDGKLRCARAGGVSEDDGAAVDKMIAAE